MKKRLLLSLLLPFVWLLSARAADVRFAVLTDIHLSPTNTSPYDDLTHTIDELLQTPGLDFVVITGDISEAGDRHSLEQAKLQFDRLQVPYYATSGNHETTWSESGCTAFGAVYGADRFAFDHAGIRFLGFNSGPTLKMMDGHIRPQDLSWLKQQYTKGATILFTHYPMQTGDVDNWTDLTDMARQYDTRCIIGGHYHRNLLFSADGIPDVLCRSNLRGRDSVGGYTLVHIEADSIRFAEKRIGAPAEQWLSLPFVPVHYDAPDKSLRPSYAVNDTFPEVSIRWQRSYDAAILEAPCRTERHLFFGDDLGIFRCLTLHEGEERWSFTAGSRIRCTPAAADDRVVFGSTDGSIYCLRERDGHLLWRVVTSAAVMGSPVITRLPSGKKAVLIGGSDHSFRALSLETGDELWRFDGLGGYVVSRPCVYDGKVFFGAWDCYFYALSLNDGSLCWKWTNGRSSDKYSPAAVWPVASNGRVFIVAPDRVFTCLDARTGEVVYRTAAHKVRESIGISSDGCSIYTRCMNDTVVAMDALSATPRTKWATNAGYGYDHNPSMMMQADDVVFFGTKNGVLHAVAGCQMRYDRYAYGAGTVLWKYKLCNTVINTALPLSATKVVVTSADGRVTCLKYK